MAWYWIVLIVIGYLIIGSFCAGIASVIAKCAGDDLDEDCLPLIVFLWPLAIPFISVVYMCHYITELFR